MTALAEPSFVPAEAGDLDGDWTHPQLAAPFDVIDLFAAGGGWDEGARAVPLVDHDRIRPRQRQRRHPHA